PVVIDGIPKADVSVVEHHMWPGHGPTIAIAHPGRAMGVVIVRCNKVGHRHAIAGISELQGFAGIADLDEINNTPQALYLGRRLRRWMWEGACCGGGPAKVRFPNGSANISRHSWLTVSTQLLSACTSANGCPFWSV